MLRTHFFCIVALGFVFLCPKMALAQQPPKVPPSSDQNLNAMGEQMGIVLGLSMRVTLTELAKPETASLLAKFQKEHFDALVKEGFTHEEALRIVCATQAPLTTITK